MMLLYCNGMAATAYLLTTSMVCYTEVLELVDISYKLKVVYISTTNMSRRNLCGQTMSNYWVYFKAYKYMASL